MHQPSTSDAMRRPASGISRGNSTGMFCTIGASVVCLIVPAQQDSLPVASHHLAHARDVRSCMVNRSAARQLRSSAMDR